MPFFLKHIEFQKFCDIIFSVKCDYTRVFNVCYHCGAHEIAPLAYMRGRTLDDSYIILDEAQNTTVEQMKMFLTRLGHNSRMVVTGDPSQTDLPDGKKSGLAVAERILGGIDGIAIHRFTERDVVRHRLVQSIIKAYERYGNEERKTGTRTITVKKQYKDKL